MPEPQNTTGVPPFPPGNKDRGVSREDDVNIGYGPANEETTAALLKIRDEQEAEKQGRPLRNPDAKSAQQAVNSREAQIAWLNTPDGRRFTELTTKLDSGERLTTEESTDLAKIRARRANRNL